VASPEAHVSSYPIHYLGNPLMIAPQIRSNIDVKCHASFYSRALASVVVRSFRGVAGPHLRSLMLSRQICAGSCVSDWNILDSRHLLARGTPLATFLTFHFLQKVTLQGVVCAHHHGSTSPPVTQLGRCIPWPKLLGCAIPSPWTLRVVEHESRYGNHRACDGYFRVWFVTAPHAFH